MAVTVRVERGADEGRSRRRIDQVDGCEAEGAVAEEHLRPQPTRDRQEVEPSVQVHVHDVRQLRDEPEVLLEVELERPVEALAAAA